MGTFDPANQQPPQMPTPYQEPFNPVQAVIGVITNPVPTLRLIAENRPWVMALLITVGIALLSGIAALLRPSEPVDPAVFQELEPEARQFAEAIVANSAGAGGLFGVILAPIGLAIGAGILFLVGRMFGGRGEYSSLFSALGFANVPNGISAALSIPLAFGGVVLAPVAALIGFLTFLWVLVLDVIAVRESMSLSTGRAVGTCAVPCVVIFLLICVASIALAGLIAAIIGSASGS
jgi:hypothetical protein